MPKYTVELSFNKIEQTADGKSVVVQDETIIKSHNLDLAEVVDMRKSLFVAVNEWNDKDTE